MLVDLDNIMFLDGVSRVDILKLRLGSIHEHAEAHSDDLHWFCNRDTQLALTKARIVLSRLHVCSSESDKADHALVHHLEASSVVSGGHDRTIVTADATLKRLALFVAPSRLRFASFGPSTNLRVRSFSLLPFRTVTDLEKFVATHALYRTRYPVTPIASSARVTPATAASGSRRSWT